jgi:hypothetical protein
VLRNAAESLWLIEMRVAACAVSQWWVCIPAVDIISRNRMMLYLERGLWKKLVLRANGRNFEYLDGGTIVFMRTLFRTESSY